MVAAVPGVAVALLEELKDEGDVGDNAVLALDELAVLLWEETSE